MLSFLYVYSDHSILECYNLFSGVELSMRSFFVIIIIIGALSAGTKTYYVGQIDMLFMSAFWNSLPIGCLKFRFSLEIHSSI